MINFFLLFPRYFHLISSSFLFETFSYFVCVCLFKIKHRRIKKTLMRNIFNYYSRSLQHFSSSSLRVQFLISSFIKWTQYGAFGWLYTSSYVAIIHITCSEKCFLHVNKFFLLLVSSLFSLEVSMLSHSCIISLMSCKRKMSSASFSFNYSSIKIFMQRKNLTRDDNMNF